ncbi:MAG: hypothetical protein Q9211_002150 [Gyalolechia sp. 1 TL-2023]
MRIHTKRRPPASLSGSSPARPQPVTPKRAPILPSFPAHYFLDFASFQYRQGQIPLISIPISRDLIDSYHDPHSTARLYFDRVHPFLPFISKVNFYEHFPAAHVQPNAVFAILVSCMKLLGWSPEKNPDDNNPKSPSYLAIKRTLAEAETAGIFSLQLLQATILITLYEVGHAIYPAAYMSAGTCARYALAQGIDAYMTIDLNNAVMTLLDQEEKRRAWWAILILDSGRPNKTVTLDQMYTVSSSAEPSMGSFAKLCQASFLLGCVFRHICDLTAERARYQEEGIQLSNRLQALLKLLEKENQISSATAVCSRCEAKTLVHPSFSSD